MRYYYCFIDIRSYIVVLTYPNHSETTVWRMSTKSIRWILDEAYQAFLLSVLPSLFERMKQVQ